MLQRQDVDAAVDADAFSRAGETGHAGVRVEVMRSGQLDVLGRHDMMLGYRNHLVTQLLRPLGEADLLGTGDRSLPRLDGRLETQHSSEERRGGKECVSTCIARVSPDT